MVEIFKFLISNLWVHYANEYYDAQLKYLLSLFQLHRHIKHVMSNQN